ncbi:sigma-54-dependent Fis family transcriptional regulator [bacterium]|nr:sigma-54-dependent Fis family transcriptional regulator [bacterium]
MPMKIDAIRFSAGSEQGPLRTSLHVADIPSLKKQEAEQLPLVYVVANQDVPRIGEAGGAVRPPARKNPHKGLARLVLRKEGIPVVKGSYRAAGQLRRSVNTLLRNADEAHDRNLFIIGVARGIFEKLWGQAIEPPAPRAAATSGASDRSSQRPRLLALLDDHEAPPELQKSYVGSAPCVHLVHLLILRAGKHNDPVLIQGDTGTGKEIVAREIHNHSSRKTTTFIPVNCGAIPGELLESELFGHEKGAFTGAVYAKTGLWKTADRGTLFLDEIADLPLSQQVKVLRAIETGEIRPVGSTAISHAHPRIIAATNRDLYAMVQAGQFREDLYYRLRTFQIATPPLRDHPEDIPLLAQHFWRSITKHDTASLPRAIRQRLRDYPWPGNARQLRTVLASMHSLFGARHLDCERLDEAYQSLNRTSSVTSGPLAAPARGTLARLHRTECLRHLKRADEVLRAFEVAVRPIVGREASPEAVGPAREQLRHHLDELDMLCLRPLLFYSATTFEAVRELKAELNAFLDVAGPPIAEAKKLWRKQLAGRFKQVHARTATEVHRLLQGL